jgi:uncharacterized membrane protein YphA (DoxX/SURF4 family)
MKVNKILLWVLRIVPAFIMLQTLYFKFTAHPDSVQLFETLGAGTAGRLGIGTMELIASVLLLIPKTTKFGALIAVGLMGGAIGSHLFILGINYNGDGGTLFGMAVVAFLTSLVLVWLYKGELMGLIQRKA